MSKRLYLSAALIAAASTAWAAEPDVTDTEVILGQTMPYSGPALAYGIQGRVETAYFDMINTKGGVSGRKIRAISLDDGYSISAAFITPDTTRLVDVRLHRSGRAVAVPPGETILDALLDAGVNVSFACTEGVCGTCETRVIDGIPDHRDTFLSDDEKANNDRIMICCSGSKTPVLILDL